MERIAKDYNEEDVIVKLTLLTSAAKLFFKKPPECQKLLGGLLAFGLNDDNQDVHDRALFYYRFSYFNV